MDKQNLIERLYALRAAISLLAMQYDKYDRAHRDKLQIYLDEADKFKNIIEKNLYQSKGKYDHYFVFPNLACKITSRNSSGKILFCYN